MPRSYRQLDLAERRTIFGLLNSKVSTAAIAEKLGRRRSTIHREIRRNFFHAQREYAGCYPVNALTKCGQGLETPAGASAAGGARRPPSLALARASRRSSASRHSRSWCR